MMLKHSFLKRLASDENGATAIEFAIVAPVFLGLMMGTFDLGHRLYVESILHGMVNKAARDSALENGFDAGAQTGIDAKLKKQVLTVHSNANINIKRRYFRSYSDAAAPTHEEFLDGNNNNICDTGEVYSDENLNGRFDANGIATGQGRASDVVIYSVDVSYPRMFPIAGFIPGMSNTVQLNSSTVLTNQPYSDRAAIVTGTC